MSEDRWCNGSTEVFGASSRGSNPCRSANLITKEIESNNNEF